MRRTSFLLGVVLLATACSDLPTTASLLAETPGSAQDTAYTIPAAFTLGGPVVSVVDFGAVPDDGGDDTAAFAEAARHGGQIYVPAGEYQLSRDIHLGARTRVFGDGARSRIVQRADLVPVFSVTGTTNAPVDSVIVEGLSFVGNRTGQHAMVVSSGRHVVFRDNRIRGMGAFLSKVSLPINILDGTTDPSATAGLLREEQLTRDLLIIDNDGDGGDEVNRLHYGINVSYSADVVVARNRMSNYISGVQWWGGDANPDRGGSFKARNPRWARRILIAENVLFDHSVGAIWGSMGQDILVANNRVGRCSDVCLDAEGSFRVWFNGNAAENAVNSVLAVFFFSEDIRFTNNHVVQDGSMGSVLFRTWNSAQYPGAVDVDVRDNTFRFTGPSGVGRLEKESSRLLTLAGNRLDNVVIAMGTNNAGDVRIQDNELVLTRNTGGRHAIEVGGNHGPATPKRVIVEGNQIRSTVPQGPDVFGIFGRQFVSGAADLRVERNWVLGFDNSIGGEGPHTVEAFDNVIDGRVQGWGAKPARIDARRNRMPEVAS